MVTLKNSKQRGQFPEMHTIHAFRQHPILYFYFRFSCIASTNGAGYASLNMAKECNKHFLFVFPILNNEYIET